MLYYVDLVAGSRSSRAEALPSGWMRWQTQLQTRTERYLTWRSRRKLRRKLRQQRRNVILDWAEAIGSAILIVLLINQFLFQAYQIPSESMVPTLLVGDRIFVNKLVYGPELVPGRAKIAGIREPRRGDVVVFENPRYFPLSPVMDVLQRVIYMATLSFVDIDTDELGQPRHHFLIKRAVGVPGDRVRVQRGEVEISVAGVGEWIGERQLMVDLDLPHRVQRLFPVEAYDDLRQASLSRVWAAAGVGVIAGQASALARVEPLRYQDYFSTNQWFAEGRFQMQPHLARLRTDWQELHYGWSIPPDRIFPMGDNRDDSLDARAFGPVRIQKVLGQALFHYWPPSRWGGIR